jgi:hypothetical protein
MKTTTDSGSSPAGGHWLQLSLFVLETIGTVIFYWKGLPLYRLYEADPDAYGSHGHTLEWSLLATALIQVGYWVRYRIGPAVPQRVNALLGHIVMFLSHLVFTLGSAVFSFVFISQKLASEMPMLRYLMMSAGLFSLFLYKKELQRLGNALMRVQKEPGESVGSEPVSARVG